MSRWWPIVAAVVIVWAGGVFWMHWFGVVSYELDVREKALDRREASLEAWSAELDRIDSPSVKRARLAAGVLDRAFGPAPLQSENEGSAV